MNKRKPTVAQWRCLEHIRVHGVSGPYGARHVLHRCVQFGWVSIVGKPPNCESRLTTKGRAALRTRRDPKPKLTEAQVRALRACIYQKGEWETDGEGVADNRTRRVLARLGYVEKIGISYGTRITPAGREALRAHESHGVT